MLEASVPRKGILKMLVVAASAHGGAKALVDAVHAASQKR
jgi:hypothetical protein